jgi:glyoxylase-like metal-dependent hydrolase (beta-lactamase superfamily II)
MAARDVAPGLIVARSGQSVFASQPETVEELLMAWRARLICPTASVRSSTHEKPPPGVFPQEMTRDVYRLGYNAKSSYGAHSFLIRRAAGNVMVDSPRWTHAVVAQLDEWGGLSNILLSHRDDVADAERYAKHFGSRVWIHEWDRSAARFANDVIKGREPAAIAADILAIPVPGHTKGSTVYLYDNRCLFSGDSLAWDTDEKDLMAWRDVCWYSWPEQTRSLERLLAYSFEAVFAGHGDSVVSTRDDMHARLKALVGRMKRE